MDCYFHHHGTNYDSLIVLAGVIVGAVLTYISQYLIFRQQSKKDVEKVEGEIINEAVYLLNKSQHEINCFAYKHDKERFEKEFEGPEHFPTLGKTLFQLRRLQDPKIRDKFETAYRACADLGNFVNMYPDPQNRNLTEFKRLIDALSGTKEAFEEHCAGYIKLKK